MSSREGENVCSFLKSKGIQLSSNSPWLSSCIRWYNSHTELRSSYGSLEEYVCIQWLLADLQDVQHTCLPADCKGRILHLNSKYSVQINWVRDIGKSCYSQLPTVNDESEDFFSEDEPKKSKWEPNQKRVFMMEITDGVNTLTAMEYSPIPKLTLPFLPGTKVILSGPIECRNGILLLKNDNLTLLGGEVEELYKKNCVQALISRCLNIENEVEDAGINNQTTRANLQTRSQNSNIENIPNSPLITNGDCDAFDKSNFMMDEDDQFLCQLPDDVLNSQEGIKNDDFGSSPVFDARTFDRQITTRMQRLDNEPEQNSAITITSNNQNKLVERKNPKLFPSLEDLRPVGRESSSIGVEAFSSSTPFTKSIKVANNSFESSVNSSLVNNTIKCQSQHSYPKPNNNEISENICDSDSIDYISINYDKYPQKKKVEIKVDSITKLKIRNGEWFCCGSVVIDNKLTDVTFSNEVLVTLFGIPATEVEIWRGEMSTNPSLKKKVNDILKAGQTKLKILKCPMTLEYSSEDCIPEVVAIHML